MYEELREEYECKERDCSDDADHRYDMMRDDFMMIECEDDAKRCIEHYPSMVSRYLPKQYKYLIKDK